jgi:hypothetical protein
MLTALQARLPVCFMCWPVRTIWRRSVPGADGRRRGWVALDLGIGHASAWCCSRARYPSSRPASISRDDIRSE